MLRSLLRYKELKSPMQSKKVTVQGTLHITKPKTIAKAILSTLSFLLVRCSSALVDCSPGCTCDLSLKRMLENSIASKTIGR